MKAKWLESGILQLEPETEADVIRLADFVQASERKMLKRLRLIPSHQRSYPCSGRNVALHDIDSQTAPNRVSTTNDH
jgi:hypothetical protein